MNLMNVSDDLIRDIDVAREALLSENYSIVVISDGKILNHEKGDGVKPFMKIIDELGNNLEGKVIGDRILGRRRV